MQNYKDTLLSQFANSPTIVSLIESFNDAIDPSVDLNNFYDFVWNVDTAQGFGLDIWGKIVNISRLLTVDATVQYLGYKEALAAAPQASDPAPFDQAPFYNGVQVTSTVSLADDAYRQLIMVKALANITNCTAPNLNKLLQFLFADRGLAFVPDTGNMTIRYVFTFDLTDVERAIVLKSGALPRPAGVLAQAMTFDPRNTFGFNEAGFTQSGLGSQPFGVGTLFNSSGLQNAN